jgi:hypothetical protein
MEKNNTGYKTTEEKHYVPIDTIDQQVYIKRLEIPLNSDWREIIPYGVNNLYPNKAIETCNRSKSCKTATKTLSKFIKGDGWSLDEINDTEFSKGVTGRELLRFVAEEKSKIAFALHVNYNLKGEVVEIQPIDFENLRWKKSDKGLKLVWRYDWRYSYDDTEIEYYPFNPENVKNEIAEVGIENYNGQVLYWTGSNKLYPLATFDPVYDEAQYQADQGVFKVRNVQNDFKASGAFTYPYTLNSDEEFKQAKQKIQKASNINDTSSIIFMGITEGMQDVAKNIWTPFERNNVDKLFEQQNKDAKESIFENYQQPEALNGRSSTGMFNDQSLQDAFKFYNSVTKDERSEVEQAFKKIFDASIWNFSEVEILPTVWITTEEITETEIIEENGTERPTDND